ncbi:hypothetical protein ABW20_dc0104812 [Dactylellina cionopaga]|nr:hypothetical protein ABW20_dc0104812 [Dactylellina cionopaga]
MTFDYIPVDDNLSWKFGIPYGFPTFAEYSLNVPAAPGLLDTGPTVRAFLPFISSDERSKLHRYEGKAAVWDARVICQKPHISNFKFHSDFIVPAISGNVRRTVSADIIQSSQPEAVPFFCAHPGEGGITICQLPNSDIGSLGFQDERHVFPAINYGGGLRSEFSTADRKTRNGGGYLILNVTLQTILDEGLELNPYQAQIGRIADRSGDEKFDEIVLGTLCYTPLDAVNRDVTISRIQQKQEVEFASFRKESIPNLSDPSSNTTSGFYVFDDLLPQLLGGNPPKNPEARSVFMLEPPQSGWAATESAIPGSNGPWRSRTNLTNPAQLHFLIDVLFLKPKQPTGLLSQGDNPSIYGNFSAVLLAGFGIPPTSTEDSYLLFGSKWQADFFKAVNDHPEGNIAVALQSLLTVVASNAFYDNFLQLTRVEPIVMSVFRNMSSPGGPYGTLRGGAFAQEQEGLLSNYVGGRFPVGYTIVAALLVLQVIAVGIILLRFLRETALTRIGDAWQALIDVASEEFEDLETVVGLSKQIGAKRADINEELQNLREKDVQVGLEQKDGSARLIRRNPRRKHKV